MTRIEQARRRLGTVRYAIGIGSAVALAVFAAAARASHPATHHSTQPRATVATDDSASGYGYFGDDSSSNIGPSGGAVPQLQSRAS